ncbi:ash family protein [Rahnella bonaserana]|uniref:Ash family protein n=2 Tax=Rahnella TaxID=34037 RepID=A0ABS6LWE8_9GAMM|nr:ash family protein [Rahnella bonaserana]
MPVFIRLVYATYLRYSAFAAAKSVAGICTPDVTTSIYIYFTLYVEAFAHLLLITLSCNMHVSMVAQRGQSPDWPASVVPGSANSV